MTKPKNPSAPALSTPGLRLRYVRENVMELSRPKMAAQLGIPDSTLKNYELGYRDFGCPEALAALFRTPVVNAHAVWVLTGSNELLPQLDPTTAADRQ